jgi:hypothetical protein
MWFHALVIETARSAFWLTTAYVSEDLYSFSKYPSAELGFLWHTMSRVARTWIASRNERLLTELFANRLPSPNSIASLTIFRKMCPLPRIKDLSVQNLCGLEV